MTLNIIEPGDSFNISSNLDEWYKMNMPDEDFSYSDSAVKQIFFIKDNVKYMLDDTVKSMGVVSSHSSKSINLPVYRIVLNGVEIIMRCNFHDWKVSVWSDFDLELPDNLFSSKGRNKINKCYCEGFQAEWVLDSFQKSKRNFTVELEPGEHYIWTLLFLISNQSKKNG